MTWREQVAAAVERGVSEQLDRGARGEVPCSPRGAQAAAIEKLINDKADKVAKELNEDSDTVALAQRTAELALLMAWRTTSR